MTEIEQITKKREKALKSFDYASKQASKCRHERYQLSCFACDDRDTCEIQERINHARALMKANTYTKLYL